MATSRRWSVLLAVVAAVACAHGPGTWDDERGNWQRAFLTEQPSGIEVVRSRVARRGPGGTIGWFLMRATPEREAELFANDLEPVLDRDAKGARAEVLGGPSWFAPGVIERYAAWRTTKEILPVILVFKDRETGELFVHLHPR